MSKAIQEVRRELLWVRDQLSRRLIRLREDAHRAEPLSSDSADRAQEQENDEVLRAIRQFPNRAFGFVYLNPQHMQASLDELNRCVRDGPMVGVKLWVAQRCNAPQLDPLMERAAELKAIVQSWPGTVV